jgi:heat shock protein HtpX
MAIIAPIAPHHSDGHFPITGVIMADASAAASPKSLWAGRALEKLSRASQVITDECQSATAHLFTDSPLTGKSLMNLFSTHPPLEET